jgi:hypothetical protein
MINKVLASSGITLSVDQGNQNAQLTYVFLISKGDGIIKNDSLTIRYFN